MRRLVTLAEMEDLRGAVGAHGGRDRREPRRDVDVRLRKRRGVEDGDLEDGDADGEPAVPRIAGHEHHVVAAGAEPLGVLDDDPVSYTHLRAHETRHDLVCRLLLETKK